MSADSKTSTTEATKPLGKLEYVERLTSWLMPSDPEMSVRARAMMTLDGVYTGKSQRIRQLIRLAYARGCRRGAACAWHARQPVTTRDAYENARQRDAVIAVMHRLKRAMDKDTREAEARPTNDERFYYCDGGAVRLTHAIEQLRSALCLPVDWAGEGDPS